ncbi:hypothetical protein [Nocardia higoensis]|uniref:hypothetical protein n=1 Tax=Nocardia higoensis TaxID=228599 RepID=UPI0002FB69E3|nr:hypothetical protein [Nocardia higoensis]
MKRGFVTETHVVIYCQTCGDCCTDRDGESICFDSIDQARRYLTEVADITGWHHTSEGVECIDCRLFAECEIRGHDPAADGDCANCGRHVLDHP